MTTNEMEMTTHNLLHYCYTCEGAALCDTEEKCKACWAEKGMLAEAVKDLDETTLYLQMMHA
ncbi:hypothetical protein [Paenibacillus pini]|uniref:Uncharacterized protein n=1 Tax=Paenibacillus pini JCM 16418 TaxID=1236976 RepID=W7YS04_9BACL|nr:hypothetical protein [Paenibacillus pini]GAF07456.1 hypothetical protein JCM16418_1472 [Paenibacillus pini JCM 16418]